MSEIATYSFLPWLRQGLSNRIQQSEGDPSVKLRANIKVDLKISGEKDGSTIEESVSKDISLYGPGDIVGIDTKAIIKNEPHNWITNFESNYLPYVDFYDEDFPWRYTPAAPDLSKHRLRPWLALVVLTEDEFKEGQNIQGRPLPFIEIMDPDAVLPPESEMWAWAHVHTNEGITPNGNPERINSSNTGHVIGQLNSLLNKDADLAQSRIVCPRKLDPQTAYHAFVVPAFEAGRIAGLGLDLNNTPFASFPAWGQAYPSGTKAEANYYPIYHRWYFRTGELGDFEYLVRLLEPKPVDSRVGRRDIDVQDPGSNLPGINDPDLDGILKLGGALQIPFDTMSDDEKAEYLKYENWDQPYPDGFQEKLSALLNLPDTYSTETVADANSNSGLGTDLENDPDPVIGPPIYGQWHALIERLLKDKNGNNIPQNDNWVHELNLDPRHRTTAGFGTKIVQQNQEAYMDAAWDQVGDVLAANRRIRLAQMAKEAAQFWYTSTFVPFLNLQTERAMIMTAPVQKRLMAGAVSAKYAVQRSVVPRAMLSAPMRKALRPRGKLIRNSVFEGTIQPGNLISRVNAGEVTATPPKVAPPELPNPEDAAAAIEPGGIKGWLLRTLSEPKWLKWLFIILGLAIFALLYFLNFNTTVKGILGGIGLLLLVLGAFLFTGGRDFEAAESAKEENMTPEAVDDLPNSPDFRVVLLGDSFKPKRGGKDSEEAIRFKGGLKDAYTLIQASKAVSVVPPRQPLDIAAFNTGVIGSLNPQVTIPNMIYAGIRIPDRIRILIGEVFTEAMAYPEFDIPMYKPLTDLSADMFLPNIQFIAENSISLLETNQPFIEAYMVGLNHEFARELLWREFPTDRRGTYFRQFWDVSSFMDRNNSDDEALREQLRDIPEMHRWSRFSKLGDHDHREQGGDKENEVVLVIRGELLKKYPTAVIYAQKAVWAETDGEFDPKKERELIPLTDAEEDNPPKSKVLTPIYEAKVDPDIYFFGFDITIPEANGDDGDNPTADNAGWFFVIKERPGEPRFGLDIGGDANPSELQVWNDLGWDHVSSEGAQVQHLRTSHNFSIANEAPSGVDIEKEPQWQDDQHISWTPNTNSADLAYILYQVPVMVAVHASEMLPNN